MAAELGDNQARGTGRVLESALAVDLVQVKLQALQLAEFTRAVAFLVQDLLVEVHESVLFELRVHKDQAVRETH